MDRKTAIILVNFKDYAERFLLECRDSLRAQTYAKEFTRIYVIDNAASEGSTKYLTESFPEAQIIARADGNYSAANNAGAQKAELEGCEYFVFANMDTKFDKDWLKELVAAADNNPMAGVIQSKILLYPKDEGEWLRPKINTLGNIFHYLGFGFTSRYGETDDKSGQDVEIMGYASGCSMLIKREVFDLIGGYNEEYYMYHDDVEISLKARLAGYKIYLAAKSIVYHKYEFERSIRMLYYMERNRYLAIFSFYKLETLIFLAPVLLVMDMVMLIYSAIKDWFNTKIEVYDYLFSGETWKKISRFRAELALIRKISEKQFVDDFAGEIHFQEIANPVLEYVGNPLMSLYWKIVKLLIKW